MLKITSEKGGLPRVTDSDGNVLATVESVHLNAAFSETRLVLRTILSDDNLRTELGSRLRMTEAGAYVALEWRNPEFELEIMIEDDILREKGLL